MNYLKHVNHPEGGPLGHFWWNDMSGIDLLSSMAECYPDFCKSDKGYGSLFMDNILRHLYYESGVSCELFSYDRVRYHAFFEQDIFKNVDLVFSIHCQLDLPEIVDASAVIVCYKLMLLIHYLQHYQHATWDAIGGAPGLRKTPKAAVVDTNTDMD